MRRGRIAVGHIDGDALLALGAQSICDEGQIDLAQPPSLRRRGYGVDLVVEELTGVEEEPADQGALPVVDRPYGGEAQEVHGVGAGLLSAGGR